MLKRGNLYIANLGEVTSKSGSIQMGKRPVIIVSNDINNFHSSMISIVPLTTSKYKKKLPTHVEITTNNSKIEKDSIALCEQIMVIPKDYIVKDEPLFTLTKELMSQINNGISIQLGLGLSTPTNRMAYAMA